MSATELDSSQLDAWREHVVIREVDAPEGHSIHGYFNACPESPDGTKVLTFLASDPEGHVGDIAIIDRRSGDVTRLATDVTVEDAHRQACQQWICNGDAVVYHDWRDGQWQVVTVDLRTRTSRVCAVDRQVGWGTPDGRHVPLYGLHWNPAEHRHLELLDVESGHIDIVLTCERITETYGAWVDKTFTGQDKCSIFFPVMSPDGKRVLFKLSQPRDGQFRSRTASRRQGLIVCEIAADQLLMRRDQWGHPAWHPDSQTIITPQNVMIDSNTGKEYTITGLPEFPGSHPGFHPTGRLCVTDSYLRGPNIPRGWWGIAVFDPQSTEVTFIHELHALPGGATSWRPPHPHPVFSHDGRRIYFNVSVDKWTRLHVAELR